MTSALLSLIGGPTVAFDDLRSNRSLSTVMGQEPASGSVVMAGKEKEPPSQAAAQRGLLLKRQNVGLILGREDGSSSSQELSDFLLQADDKSLAEWAMKQNLTYVKLSSGTLLADEDSLGILLLKRQAWAMALVEKGVTKVDLQAEGEEGRRTLAQLASFRPQHEAAMRSAPLTADLSLEFHISFQRSDGSILQCTEPLKRALSGPGKSGRQTVPKSRGDLPAMKSAFPSLTLASKIREQFFGKMNPIEQAKLRREASQVIEGWTQEASDRVNLLRSLCLAKAPPLLRKLMDQARFRGPIKVGSLPEDEKAQVKTMLMLSGHSGEDTDSLSLTHGFLGAKFGVRVTLPDGKEGNFGVVEYVAP